MKSPVFISRFPVFTVGYHFPFEPLRGASRLGAQTPSPWPGFALVVARFPARPAAGFSVSMRQQYVGSLSGGRLADLNDTGSFYPAEKKNKNTPRSSLKPENERSFVLSFLQCADSLM